MVTCGHQEPSVLSATATYRLPLTLPLPLHLPLPFINSKTLHTLRSHICSNLVPNREVPNCCDVNLPQSVLSLSIAKTKHLKGCLREGGHKVVSEFSRTFPSSSRQVSSQVCNNVPTFPPGHFMTVPTLTDRWGHHSKMRSHS